MRIFLYFVLVPAEILLLSPSYRWFNGFDYTNISYEDVCIFVFLRISKMASAFWPCTPCRYPSFCTKNKGRVEGFFSFLFNSPRLSARCVCSSQVGGALVDSTKPARFLLCAFPRKSRSASLIQFLIQDNMLQLHEWAGQEGDWQGELVGYPLWPRHLWSSNLICHWVLRFLQRWWGSSWIPTEAQISQVFYRGIPAWFSLPITILAWTFSAFSL